MAIKRKKEIMQFIISILFLSVLSFGTYAFEPLTVEDQKHLEKQKVVEHVVFEMYSNTDKGAASVFGYYFDVFYWPKLYFTTSIFGAVGGERGGYGIAAFGFGYQMPINDRFIWDTRLVTGSGGGGGLPAGGGFAIEGHTGVSIKLAKSVLVDIKAGYLTFPTGEFNTPVFQVGVTHQAFKLVLPY